MSHNQPSAVEELRALGVDRNVPVAIAIGADGVGIAVGSSTVVVEECAPAAVVAEIEDAFHPRWVWWDQSTARTLVAGGTRVAACWDLSAVHRLLFGGWRAGAARVWATLHDLDPSGAPSLGQLDLLAAPVSGGSPDDPVQPDGYLQPEWVDGQARSTAIAAAKWASLALEARELQQARLEMIRSDSVNAGDPIATARSESAAELLCAELAIEGLPVSIAVAGRLLQELIGPRPRDDEDAARLRARRDALVTEELPAAFGIDLRSPADVKTLLRRLGIDVPDTRAWRLEALRESNPSVDALLRWRKAERIATTFGYGWLDAHVGADGRLRGEWAGSDGAAGRMTAQAGLHNMPAELREIVVAEPDHVFVRADLGQIEPRVLAAVSRDASLIAATHDDDMYAPVARRLGVERPVAKVAVLAAMYGQTSGTAGQALRGLEAAYPVAMTYLADAARAGEEGRELRTFGGRLLRMYDIGEASDHRAAAAGRGRYARNAMVQGAAAELFKAWAATVRARGADLDARIVLCLHDELLVHVPTVNADATATSLHDCLTEAATRWQRGAGVRFVADVSISPTWSKP